jgi:uncharacterized protein
VSLPCPSCKIDLVMSDRQGVEIDYCPKCRGVWLDRGELDKILERAETAVPAPRPALSNAVNSSLFGQVAPQPPPQQPPPRAHDGRGYDDRRRYHDDDDDDDRRKHAYGHKRKSWLSDIFD